MIASGWHISALACGGISVLILTVMSLAVWLSSEKGSEVTTQRLLQVSSVIADRYFAWATVVAFLVWNGDLAVVAAFFVVGAFIWLAGDYIYARRGLPQWKHTVSGILSAASFGIIMVAPAKTGAA